jgi:hypothetical protein
VNFEDEKDLKSRAEARGKGEGEEGSVSEVRGGEN